MELFYSPYTYFKLLAALKEVNIPEEKWFTFYWLDRHCKENGPSGLCNTRTNEGELELSIHSMFWNTQEKEEIKRLHTNQQYFLEQYDTYKTFIEPVKDVMTPNKIVRIMFRKQNPNYDGQIRILA